MAFRWCTPRSLKRILEVCRLHLWHRLLDLALAFTIELCAGGDPWTCCLNQCEFKNHLVSSLDHYSYILDSPCKSHKRNYRIEGTMSFGLYSAYAWLQPEFGNIMHGVVSCMSGIIYTFQRRSGFVNNYKH